MSSSGKDRSRRGEVTRLLHAWRRGEPDAVERLMERVHPDLRRIAANHFRAERAGHTLQPTALVHEAFVRLVDDADVDWKSRRHFFALASKVMRRVLVDHARERQAEKRHGVSVTLRESDALHPGIDVDILDLHAALERLEKERPTPAKVVQLRFFGGLSIDEVADELQIGHATVERSWAFAKAWLFRELS